MEDSKQRAKEITEWHLNMPSCESVEAAKYAAQFTVKQIQNELKVLEEKVTPSLGWDNRFKYWESVSDHIDKF